MIDTTYRRSRSLSAHLFVPVPIPAGLIAGPVGLILGGGAGAKPPFGMVGRSRGSVIETYTGPSALGFWDTSGLAIELKSQFFWKSFSTKALWVRDTPIDPFCGRLVPPSKS